jgi:hypothetical protein
MFARPLPLLLYSMLFTFAAGLAGTAAQAEATCNLTIYNKAYEGFEVTLEAIFGDTIKINDDAYDNAQGQSHVVGDLSVYDTLEVVLSGGTCELSAEVSAGTSKAQLVVASDQTGRSGSKVVCDRNRDFSNANDCTCTDKKGWNFATLNYSCIAE